MGKVNGSTMLVYCDGVLIAAQKSTSVNLDVNLFDTSSKDSNGWAEHGQGQRSATIPFEALYSTTGLSAEGLKDYLFNRQNMLFVVDGIGSPFVCEASGQDMSINGVKEEAVSISGTVKVNGGLYFLDGDFAKVVTDFTNTDYDTFTEANTVIASAINSAGNASATASAAIDVTSGDVFKAFCFLTLNSGQLPSVELVDSGGGNISNVEALAEGANFITLTATDTDASSDMKISNTGASNFATGTWYIFKV